MDKVSAAASATTTAVSGAVHTAAVSVGLSTEVFLTIVVLGGLALFAFYHLVVKKNS